DECRELVLGERELQLRVAIHLREIEQVLRYAARHVEEDEVFDAVREPADGLRERIQDHADRLRMRFEEREEIVAREQGRTGVLHSRCRRGARASVEERELAEE